MTQFLTQFVSKLENVKTLKLLDFSVLKWNFSKVIFIKKSTFTPVTRVRIPLGVPQKKSNDFFFLSFSNKYSIIHT